jgi:hypothetical protein
LAAEPSQRRPFDENTGKDDNMNEDPSMQEIPARRGADADTPEEAIPERLAWLFRDSLRQHRIHPLMEILRRHREAGAP